ncbi:MAG: aldehyde dehydrogenase [Ignavibacteria bacterium]|nr:aldehyde dehydrogenase [Ignavibacteria bacterium]
MQTILNFIGGEFLPPQSGNYLNNYEPATGNIYSKVPDSDERDVALAVVAAKNAFPAWSATSIEVRSEIMLRIAALITERLEQLALAETIDQGKPLWLSKSMDIPRAAQNFHFFGTEILHFASEAHPTTGYLNYTLRSPIGVVGCISPWNLPLYLFTWKIAPAIATGNCVVAKPSELTPMTAFLLAAICKEAGLPAGVLNIVHGLGHEVGTAMSEHRDIHAISFTGGTNTGQKIAKIAAPMFKKLSLELGGKNPNIVFADCNLSDAALTSARAAFTNQGEICLCGSRIFIERSIYSEFKEKFIENVRKFTVGDPLDPATRQGALVSLAHLDKVLSYIQIAKDEGGTIALGGNQINPEGRCANGWFVEPTVIEGLGADCRINQEEIFGPVVSLVPFDTEEEALSMANSTPYGLAAVVWTENLSKAHRVAAKLESGIVWINCWMVRDLRTPFGGVKHSGVGREGGFEALKFFTEPKNVCVKM